MLNFLKQFSPSLNQPHYQPPHNPPVNLSEKSSTAQPPSMQPPSMQPPSVQPTPVQTTIMRRRSGKPSTAQPPSVQPPIDKSFRRVINLLYNDNLSMELSLPDFISAAKPSASEILEILHLLAKAPSDTLKNRASKLLIGLVENDLLQTFMHDSEHLGTLLTGGILILKETSLDKISECTKYCIINILISLLSKSEELRALITTHTLQQELIDSLIFNLEDPPSCPTTLATKNNICRLLNILVYKQDDLKKELQQVYDQRLNAVLTNMLLQALELNPDFSNYELTYLKSICSSLRYLNINQNGNQPLLVYKYKSRESTTSELFIEFTTSELLEIVSLLKEDQPDTLKRRASKVLISLASEPTFHTFLHDSEHLGTLLTGGILILKETSLDKISECTKQYMLAIFMNLSKDDHLRALITTHPLQQELIDRLLLHLEDPPNFPTTLATKEDICKLLHNLVGKQDGFKEELQQVYGQRLIAVWANMMLQALVPDPNLSNDEQTCLKSIYSLLHYLNINQNGDQPLLLYKSVELTNFVRSTNPVRLKNYIIFTEDAGSTKYVRSKNYIIFRKDTGSTQYVVRFKEGPELQRFVGLTRYVRLADSVRSANSEVLEILSLLKSVKLTDSEVLEILGLLKKDHSDKIKLPASKFLKALFSQSTFQALLNHPEHLDSLMTGGILILKETSLDKSSECTKQNIIAIFAYLSQKHELRELITKHPLWQELIDSLLLNLEDPPSFTTTLATKDYICILFLNLIHNQNYFKKELCQVYGQRLIDAVLNMLQALLPVLNEDQQIYIEHICFLLEDLNSNRDFDRQLYAYQKVPLLEMLLTLLNPKDTANLTESTPIIVCQLLEKLVFMDDMYKQFLFLKDITHHYNSPTIQVIVTILNEYDQSWNKLHLAEQVTDLLRHLVYEPDFREHLTLNDFQQLTTTLSNILLSIKQPYLEELKDDLINIFTYDYNILKASKKLLQKSLASIFQFLTVDPFWSTHRQETPYLKSFTKFLTFGKFSFTFSSKPSGEATEPSEKAAENEQLSASP